MNLCSQCQSLQADAAKFCNDCGRPLLPTVPAVPPAFNGQTTPQQQATLNKASRIVGGFMLVGAMFFAGVLVMALLNPRESATTARASSDASSTPMPTPRRYHSAENLRAYYQKLMSEINPHLNFITTALVKVKGGYALYAYHDFFSEFTFSVGDDAKAVATFTNVYQDDLRQAKIVRVGVSGKGEFASGKYFEVK